MISTMIFYFSDDGIGDGIYLKKEASVSQCYMVSEIQTYCLGFLGSQQSTT